MHLGELCPEFTSRAVDGQNLSNGELAGPSGLVVMFLSATCPYVLAQEDRLLSLARSMKERGVGFVAVCSNTDPDLAPGNAFSDIRRHAREKAYSFPYLYDDQQRLADAFGAHCTPDLFAFNAQLRLHYHGRLDDNWKDPEAVQRRWLKEALDAMLAGRPTPETPMPAFGCAIKRNSADFSAEELRVVASQYLRVLEHAEGLRIVHVLNGTEIQTKPDMMVFLGEFRTPASLSEVKQRLDLPDDSLDVFRSLVAAGFLVKQGTDELESLRARIDERQERIRSGSLLSILRLNIATDCNLRCTYCYMEAEGVDRRKTKDSQMMPWPIARRAVEMFMQNAASNGRRHVTNRYIGGEPLLNRRVLRATMTLAEEMGARLGIAVTHLLCTNGLLLNRSFVRFLKGLRDAHVLVSLDGIRENNDRMRVDQGGGATFDRIVDRLRILLDEGVPLGVPAVVSHDNYRGMEAFLDEMHGLGVRNIGLNPQYYLGHSPFPPEDASDLVEVLARCRSKAQRYGMELSGKAFLPEWHVRNGHLANCEAMGRAVVVDPDGSLSLCDKIPGRLGTVDDLRSLLESDTYAQFAMRVRTRVEGCSECEAKWVCNGGCLADSLLAETGSGAPAANCDFIRRMAARILLPLDGASADVETLYK